MVTFTIKLRDSFIIIITTHHTPFSWYSTWSTVLQYSMYCNLLYQLKGVPHLSDELCE